jgi:hypothetical protein
MPQTLGPWRQIPFSYFKVCLAVTAWFFALLWVAITLLLDGTRLMRSALWDAFLIPVVVFLVCRLVFHILYRVVWDHLSAEFREDLAYDVADAAAGKGTIHSYRDLSQWIRRMGRVAGH